MSAKVNFAYQQTFISNIIEMQKLCNIQDKELIQDIIETTRWWKIKNGKLKLEFVEAIELINRLGLNLEISLAKQIILSIDAKQAR